MFFKKSQPKKFNYQPRYYKLEKDNEEKRKRKLGFKSSHRNKRKIKVPWAYIIMLAIIVFIYLKYNGYI